jgi:hypothetical protein
VNAKIWQKVKKIQKKKNIKIAINAAPVHPLTNNP